MDNRVTKALFKFQVMPIFSGVITPISAVPNTHGNIVVKTIRSACIWYISKWHAGKQRATVERISDTYLLKRIAV